MNFSNKELFKIKENELQNIPIVKPEVHFLLNELSQKILQGDKLSTSQNSDLEIVWDELQYLDRNFTDMVDLYRSNGVITKNELLIVAGFFLSSQQIGPVSNILKDQFCSIQVPIDSFNNSTFEVSIPEYTRKIIQETYRKIYNFKNNS